jgi:hypothetical protein
MLHRLAAAAETAVLGDAAADEGRTPGLMRCLQQQDSSNGRGQAFGAVPGVGSASGCGQQRALTLVPYCDASLHPVGPAARASLAERAEIFAAAGGFFLRRCRSFYGVASRKRWLFGGNNRNW